MKSEIHFTVELDENRVPERISWDATENPNEGINDTKGISVNVWDHYHRGLLGINLWTKDLPVDDMNHFAIDIVGNISQMIKDSTKDEKLILYLEEAGKKMADHLKELAEKEKEQA